MYDGVHQVLISVVSDHYIPLPLEAMKILVCTSYMDPTS